MQRNVCSPAPGELQRTVISEPPPLAAGHCCGLRVLQAEGTGSVELVLNSNSFTDTSHTEQHERGAAYAEVSVLVQLTGGEVGPQ